jgi:hydrogenase maturation protease
LTGAPETVLVLGLGNILLGDEGVGVRVAEALEAGYDFDPAVDIVDGGTSGMDMLDIIADRPHVVVIDAVNTGDRPGTLVTLTGEAAPAFFRNRISPHQLGLSDLLGALMLMDRSPRGLTLVGCVPESLDTSLDLTPRIAARLPEMVAMTVEALAGLGVRAVPKSAAA